MKRWVVCDAGDAIIWLVGLDEMVEVGLSLTVSGRNNTTYGLRGIWAEKHAKAKPDSCDVIGQKIL